MKLRKDYVSDFAFVIDSDNETAPYYIGNSPGKKVGNSVYFRWEDGLFFKRNLSNNRETPIKFLNDMNLSMDTAVGFMDDFIVVERMSNGSPSVQLYDFYGYDGTKKDTDHHKQTDEYIYTLIETNLKDITQTVKRCISVNESGGKFEIIKPDLTGKLTLSAIENLYLSLKEQQLIGSLISKNFEKCFQLVKDSGTEDPAKAFHNIIAVLYEYGNPENFSVFQEKYILKLLTVLSDTMEKAQFAQTITDYEALESAVCKLINKR